MPFGHGVFHLKRRSSDPCLDVYLFEWLPIQSKAALCQLRRSSRKACLLRARMNPKGLASTCKKSSFNALKLAVLSIAYPT